MREACDDQVITSPLMQDSTQANRFWLMLSLEEKRIGDTSFSLRPPTYDHTPAESLKLLQFSFCSSTGYRTDFACTYVAAAGCGERQPFRGAGRSALIMSVRAFAHAQQLHAFCVPTGCQTQKVCVSVANHDETKDTPAATNTHYFQLSRFSLFVRGVVSPAITYVSTAFGIGFCPRVCSSETSCVGDGGGMNTSLLDFSGPSRSLELDEFDDRPSKHLDVLAAG